MASPVAVLDILVRANTGGASAQLTTLDRQLKGTAATATTTGAAIGKRLATAAKYGALGLAGLGAVSVKMAIDFDRSMRNVNSIAQLNEKQFDKLGERVRSLAGKTAQAPETLAEGLYDLVSSGFDANESMKVLKASANAATAGLTDTATSTKAVAATLNAYRMPAQKAGKVSDILFRTVDRGVISFDELAGTIGNVLPAATTLGVKLPEVGAAISTLTKEGQSGATAVTNINAAMTALFKPSEAMKAALQSIGYESAQALVQAKGFEGALKTLIASTDGSAESIGALFANVRAQRAVFGLTGKNAEAAAADLRGLQDSAGATQRALDEQSKSVAFMWKRLKAQASSLAIGIGDELLPKIKKFLEILANPKLTLSEKVAKLGTKLTETIEEWGPKVAKAGAAVGLAIVKGIWGAFWDSDLLGKLFIGAAALRLFGGPGVFSNLGGTIATKIGGGMKARFGAIGPGILATIILGGIEGLQEENLTKKWAGVIEKNLPMLRLQRDALTGTKQYLAEQLSMWKAMGHKINERVIWTWMENGKISAAGAARLIKILKPLQQKWQQAFMALAVTTKKTGSDIHAFTGRTAGWLRAWANNGGGAIDKLSDALKDPFQKSLDKTKDKVKSFTESATDKLKDFADDAGGAFDKTSDKSKRMQQKVGANIMNLARTVTSGLEIIVGNTNKALKGFGVKKVAITLSNVGDAAKGFQRGGTIVPGTGSGDKVPLHIGGRLSAMVEPGELVSVTNRTATAAQMALNRKIPRRARGGTVPGATGGLHPSILGLVNSLYSRFGGSVTSGLRAGDSSSLHSTGQAADYVPSNWPAAAAAVNRVGSSLLEGIYNPSAFGGPAVSWDSGGRVPSSFWGSSTWAAHANHIHLAIADGTKAVAGAAVEQIKRVLLKGPKGPLRDMGQAALDKVHSAANAYLKKVMPRVGVEAVGPGANVKNLPSALQKYNHIYAEHNSADGDWGGFKMPFNAVAALAEWAGAPGISMARTAIGESNLRPGATGIDPGGTKGLGLWMITTGYNDALIKSLGGEAAMRNPILNAKAMNSIYDSQGIGAWYSSTKDGSGTHYNGPLLRKFGGIVPHLAKGGKPGKAGFKPGPTDPAYKRFVKAQRFADKLKGLVGEKGRIARLDERIQIAETMAGLDSSELGSDLGPNERQKQIRLNEALLARMVMARKLARTGLHWLDFPKGMSTAAIKPSQLKGLKGRFTQTLLDLTGLTGRSGRIFDTRMQLDALKHTSTTGAAAEALDISGLRAMLEAARYGVFDGYYAKGGTIGRGKWGVVGENGPEIVHGPATVTPSPQVTVENNFDWEGMDLYVTTTVDGQIAKREKLSRRRARQMVR